MYQHIIMQLKNKGYYTILEVLKEEDEEGLVLPGLITESKADGIIFVGQLNKDYSEKAWELHGNKIIFMDFYDFHAEYDVVISDGFHGMYLLTSYFIRKGLYRIGFIGTPLATSSITDRYFGYLRALFENGIQANPDWIINDREEKHNVLIPLRLPEVLPDAFVCNCDTAAVTLSLELEKTGIQDSKKIEIGGFDNYVKSGGSRESFTTYDINMEKMVLIAVKTLIDKIHGRDYIKGVQTVTGQIIERD